MSADVYVTITSRSVPDVGWCVCYYNATVCSKCRLMSLYLQHHGQCKLSADMSVTTTSRPVQNISWFYRYYNLIRVLCIHLWYWSYCLSITHLHFKCMHTVARNGVYCPLQFLSNTLYVWSRNVCDLSSEYWMVRKGNGRHQRNDIRATFFQLTMCYCAWKQLGWHAWRAIVPVTMTFIP